VAKRAERVEADSTAVFVGIYGNAHRFLELGRRLVMSPLMGTVDQGVPFAYDSTDGIFFEMVDPEHKGEIWFSFWDEYSENLQVNHHWIASDMREFCRRAFGFEEAEEGS
jgi:hypothetical protein